MSHKILQINLRFYASRTEFETVVAPLAELIAAAPGLSWSMWLINEADREAGGIYLFASGDSLECFLNSERLAGLVNHPLLSDLSVKQFDVIKALGGVTGRPGRAAVVA